MDSLQEEITGSLKKLIPQLQGLQGFYKVLLSNETKEFVLRDIERFENRKELCVDVLEAITQLKNDGYPDMPQTEVPYGVIEELREQLNYFTAALDVYAPSTRADGISLDFGEPVDKE